MAATKTSALTALIQANIAVATDLLMLVDVSDTTMAGSGTNKKVTAQALVQAVAAALATTANLGWSDIAFYRNAAGTVEVNNGTPGTFADIKSRDIFLVPSASLTPVNNGDLRIEATDNTTLTFKYKGSDGTIRSGTITLS